MSYTVRIVTELKDRKELTREQIAEAVRYVFLKRKAAEERAALKAAQAAKNGQSPTRAASRSKTVRQKKA